jgi:ABC-2 type transport system permease protein
MGAKMNSPVYAMWLRQVKKHLRSKPRMIGSLGQPILFLVALGYGFGTIFQQAGEGNFITFLAPGIVAMSILFSAMFTGIEVIWDRQFGFLKETLVAPVSRFRIMLGRTLGGATAALIQGFIVFLISIALGFRPSLIMLPVAFVFMASIAILFTSLGTALASKMQDMQAFPLIMNLLMMPLFFLSGALFPLDKAPEALKLAVYLNPLAYGVDGIRATTTGVSHFGLAVDLAVQLGLTLLVLFIGSRLFEKIEV